MSEIAIQVERLSKKYTIGHQRAARDGLRHALEDAFRSPLRWFRQRQAARAQLSEDFWALNDVSFDVKQGEVVGIIGRNGAGKSTLLKILSRITEPTSGSVRIRGRVASLLEVGTGFHQELTGRENIFLNGAILGMSKAEIKRKFDEIVAFSEVEKFLDTPVKRYSSGMYVRLAFAVAAHLEPEILIVDEVLAVGDAEFQKKCLGKMGEVSKAGRTVLFVSHQLSAVTRLCSTAIWLANGKLKEAGETAAICTRYLSQGSSAGAEWISETSTRPPGNQWVRLEKASAGTEIGPSPHIPIDKATIILLHYRVLQPGKVLIPNIHLYNDEGTLLFIAHDWFSGWRETPKPVGDYRTTFSIPEHFFNEGRMTVKVVITTYNPFEVHFEFPDAVTFTIIDQPSPQSARGDYTGHYPGALRPYINTSTVRLPQES